MIRKKRCFVNLPGSSLATWVIYGSGPPFPKLDARSIGHRRVGDFPDMAKVVIGFA
ncbi:MAG: hypothetical protein WB347_01925 [Terriglobales bacterium]|jgi:hypothetical protein